MAKFIQKIKLGNGPRHESNIVAYLIDGVRYSKTEAVALAGRVTLKSNNSPNPIARVVSENGKTFLRTDANSFKTDNLLSLPTL